MGVTVPMQSLPMTLLVTMYNVPVVDSTGAGDTFNAAFLTSTIADCSLEKRIEFACAAGAISVTGLGPKGHLPSFDETFEFMSMNEENTK